MIAKTPKTPYYAVIFSSLLSGNKNGYSEMAVRMEELAKDQKGFLGFESAREALGITVSYWKDLESIIVWKENLEHQKAQQKGKEVWYKSYKVRVCKVERDYGFGD
ncbi:MAG: antibiotic biosynthesis monooxygenase [Bacteroidota bacterium]